VHALKDVVFTAIFSKSNPNEARKAFQSLAFLNGSLMLPPLVNKLYESLESVTEPLRYTSILGCFTLVAREMARVESTRMDLIPLISAILPGLDPNDSNKCILTLQLLSNIFSSIILLDCSKANQYRTDLSEPESTLCFETSKLEDFLHEFFKRVFYIVDYLASDNSGESSASAAAASNQFSINGRHKNAHENIYQAHLMQTLRIIVRQSSNAYLKLILNKVGSLLVYMFHSAKKTGSYF
jgi:proteasome activator subunit 4